MRRRGWKWAAAGLLLYTVVMGFAGTVPRLPILNETIRNLYFHVPMWFGMTIILTISVVYSVRYLLNPQDRNDDVALAAANVGILFGVLGILTGSVWARYTWGAWWVPDVKLNAAAVATLIYLAYGVLRGSLTDREQAARIGAVYNVFAYAALVPLLFVLPRLTDSLHPGNGGNPGFNAYDLDRNLRMVFYPAVIGWTLLGWWIATLQIRLRRLEARREEHLLTERTPVAATDL
ncbi:MAG: cytochrome c biogenesis protein [Catalinimonas sp.]